MEVSQHGTEKKYFQKQILTGQLMDEITYK